MKEKKSAKIYIKNERPLFQKKKSEVKNSANIYIQNERPLFQEKKSEVKNSANIYLQNERPLFQKKKKKQSKKIAQTFINKMRDHYFKRKKIK